MRSGKYFFNMTIFRKNIVRFIPLWAGYLFFMLLCMPMAVYNICADGSRSARLMADVQKSIDSTIQSSLEGSVLFLIFAFAIVAATALFSYLYTSRSAVFYHSIPIRREGLFITNYLSGIAFILGPNLLTALITGAVAAAEGYSVTAVLGEWLVASSCIMVFFYSFAVFCAMFTGQLVALPIFYIILNFYLTFMAMLTDMLLSFFCYGRTETFTSFGSYMCPFVRFAQMSTRYSREMDAAGNQYMQTVGGYLDGNLVPYLLYALAGIVLAALALVIYRLRNIESAGDTISVRCIRPVFRWGVGLSTAVSGGLLLSAYFFGKYSAGTKPGLAVTCVICGIIGFLAAEMIMKKSFRVFRKCYKELLMFVGVMAVSFVLLGFGAFSGSVPQADEVREVRISARNSLYTEDYGNIEEIIDIHSQIVSQESELEWLNRQISNSDDGHIVLIRFNYSMKDGSSVKREYSIPYTPALQNKSDSVISRIISIFNRPENIEAVLLPETLNEESIMYSEIQLYDRDLNHMSIGLSREQSLELYRAAKKDVESGRVSLGARAVLYDYLLEDLTDLYYDPITFILYSEQGSQGGMGENASSTANRYIDLWFSSEFENVLKVIEGFGIYNEGGRLITYGEYYGYDTK